MFVQKVCCGTTSFARSVIVVSSSIGGQAHEVLERVRGYDAINVQWKCIVQSQVRTGDILALSQVQYTMYFSWLLQGCDQITKWDLSGRRVLQPVRARRVL